MCVHTVCIYDNAAAHVRHAKRQLRERAGRLALNAIMILCIYDILNHIIDVCAHIHTHRGI